jgi:LPXTG-motif cell wall-anchored protein
MKTRVISLVVLVALVVLLALPMSVSAQETDPEALLTTIYETLVAGDFEGVLSYYADDAVLTLVPIATYTGKEEIRTYFEEFEAGNATLEVEILQVEGDTVTSRTWYSNDDLRALGLTLESIDEITFQDGKIVTETATLTDESLAALQAAMATLPETGGETLPFYALVMILGGLVVSCGLGVGFLRRRSHQVL